MHVTLCRSNSQEHGLRRRRMLMLADARTLQFRETAWSTVFGLRSVSDLHQLEGARKGRLNRDVQGSLREFCDWVLRVRSTDRVFYPQLLWLATSLAAPRLRMPVKAGYVIFLAR